VGKELGGSAFNQRRNVKRWQSCLGGGGSKPPGWKGEKKSLSGSGLRGFESEGLKLAETSETKRNVVSRKSPSRPHSQNWVGVGERRATAGRLGPTNSKGKGGVAKGRCYLPPKEKWVTEINGQHSSINATVRMRLVSSWEKKDETAWVKKKTKRAANVIAGQ